MVVSGLFHTIYWRLLIISYHCIYNVWLQTISYNFIIVLIWLNISHKIQSLKDGSRCSCVSFCCLRSIFWLLLRDWCVLNFPMFHSWIEPKSFLSKNIWGRPGLISLHPKFCLFLASQLPPTMVLSHFTNNEKKISQNIGQMFGCLC